MTVVGTYDSDQQNIFFTRPVDITGDVDQIGPVLNITGDVNLSGNLTVGGSSPGGDIVVAAGSEYFQAYLTDYQTNINNLSDNNDTWTVLDFEGKGAQTGNTANWDASTNSYTLGSTGLYQISFQAYFPDARYDATSTTEKLTLAEHENIGVYVEYSADNWSSSAIAFAGGFSANAAGPDSLKGRTISGTYLFTPTSASTKIRLRGAADPGGTATSGDNPIVSHVIKPWFAIKYDFDGDYRESIGNPITDDNRMGETLQPATFFNVVRLH